MIKELSSSFKKAKKLQASFLEKGKIFFSIVQWELKKKSKKKQKNIVKGEFLGFSFLSYNYWTIDYLFDEIFLNNEYYFKTQNKTPLIMDCGSNIGMSILYFKHLYPNSRIIGFEPNPNSFKLLKKNVEENNLKNVEINNLGLYNEESEISFYIDSNLSTLIGSINKDRGGNKELKVSAKKLSSYLKDVEEVDLVKIDVEGAEINIIMELLESNTLNKVKEYIIEYHHNMGEDRSNLSSFLAIFETNGYDYNIKTSFKNISSFQDILIHFYKKAF